MRAGFRIENVFEFDRALEQFLDARKRAGGAGNAGVNGIAGAFEIVPGEMLNVRAEHEICMAFPGFELMFLRGGNGPRDNLKNVFRSAAMAVLHSDGDSQNSLCTELARSDGWHLGDEAAVGKAAGTDFYGLEEAGKGAAGANGINKRALLKDDGIASGQIGSDHGRGDLQVFELARFEDAVH
jgi:hypothetical protein